jgi:hypothetical protein
MSAPIKHVEKSQDALMYAPPWARERMRAMDLVSQAASALPKAATLGDSTIDWPPAPSKPARFEGDVAIMEMRRRLSLDPNLVPEPPLRMQRRPVTSSLLTRLPLYIGLAAIVAYGFVELTESYGQRPISVKSDAGIASAKASRLNAPPAGNEPMAAPRLVIEDRQAFTNDPIPLGAKLVGATGVESIFLNGLVKGTQLSAGEPYGSTGWRVSARELANILAYAPNYFVGVMDAEIELRSGNNVRLDTQVARLEWITNTVGRRSIAEKPLDQGDTTRPELLAARLDSERLSRLIKRGLEFLKDGDIAASRLLLRPAADAGNAQAALMLGATFDPVVLAELGVFGLMGDRTTAREWYRKAMDFGSAEAWRRFERLAQTDK